jgi:hypothetical protein
MIKNNDTSGYLVARLVFKILDIIGFISIIENIKWYQVESCFECKIGSQKGKLLSYGDQFVLTDSVLISLPMLMVAMSKGLYVEST